MIWYRRQPLVFAFSKREADVDTLQSSRRIVSDHVMGSILENTQTYGV